MRGSQKVDWIFLLLVLIMIEFAAATIYLPIQHMRVAAGIEQASRFELAFVAQEARVDLATLNQDVARYLQEPNADRARSIGADYAALVERGRDFRRGDFGAFVAGAAEARTSTSFYSDCARANAVHPSI